MGFEIEDGNHPLPDEEDIYGINDIEEEERFNALLGYGAPTQEERLRRRRILRIITAVLVLVILFGVPMLLGPLHSILGH